MIKRSVDRSGKDWFTGPRDSDVPVAVGYVDEGIDGLHVHDSMYEIYFVARGTSSALVAGQLVNLQAG